MRKKRNALIQFNRHYILEASKQLFLEKGIEKTTVDDIAKLADCSKSTIYVYFKSKEEIFNYIVYEYMSVLRQGIEDSIQSSAEFIECYYAICRKMVDFRNQYPMYFESILAEISVQSEDFEQQPILKDIHRVGEEINSSLENFIRKAIEDGHLRSELDPLLTVFSLWGSICGIISLADKKRKYFESDLNLDKQKFLEYSFELLLSCLLK
ncbi:TetR/AcrR family transcriptional regulator [Clostridium aminobutyricum]|uniref:TetR/AcrR family transcriptional regulator n=1 Tax=Clostridium aminobutyricum TaxID=33953 RepID=A0A939IFT4_CLOAM|nr:TetR/AcrR family transcriptional regulator [Clostridium aminobutyricum]MBN7771865.1 TetR/AcrR family transcriptional regulator [Clostridium aminobutyricum]